jgi:hypothetical protein
MTKFKLFNAFFSSRLPSTAATDRRLADCELLLLDDSILEGDDGAFKGWLMDCENDGDDDITGGAPDIGLVVEVVNALPPDL